MNTLYPKARKLFRRGELNWDGDTIRAALLTSGYVYDEDHEFLVDIAPAYRISVVDVTSRNYPDWAPGADYARGVCEFYLPEGSTGSSIVFFKDTGDSSSSPLIAFYDDVQGLPCSSFGYYGFSGSSGYFRL